MPISLPAKEKHSMDADVVIVGAGPNGLMLACELALAGVRAVVLESLSVPSDVPKANGLVGQVVRLVDRRGLYEPLGGGTEPPTPNSAYFMFAALPLDLSLLSDSPIYTLAVVQRRMVEVLEERASELGVRIRRGHQVTGLAQDDDAVTVDVSGPDGDHRLTARYLVGADGAHSVTRKAAGIEFPGITYDRTITVQASVTMPDGWVDSVSGALNVPGHGPIRPFLPYRTDSGGFAYTPLPGQSPQLIATEWDRSEPDGPATLEELRASIGRVLGVDVPFGPPTGDGQRVLRRLSGGNIRVAERFRDRRVFLVGDAAHVLYTAGGQGLNLGMQDAANLGWKLAAEIRGRAQAGLLDSYETERRSAVRRATVYSAGQVALIAPGSDVTALRELFAELLGDRDTVWRVAELTAGSDVRYDMGVDDPHPLVGRFAPDMVLDNGTGTNRLAELTRTGRPLLLDLTEDGSVAAGWEADEVDVVAARPLGADVGATALLIRPDCYVAWASSSPQPDSVELSALHAAVRRWFGVAALV
jgi:2-polyprenyl-6-methoxyphenol hydroxylase-like FAD-dependent oxidoreductase